MNLKGTFAPYFSKGNPGRLLGNIKGVGRLLNDPLVGAGVAFLSPELGAGLALAKKTGLLEKLK